ncbi:MAG: CHAP domain-containing protein [Caulobacterales bacterium]
MKTGLIAAFVGAACLCAVVAGSGSDTKIALRGRLAADLLPSPSSAAAQEAHLNYPSLKSLGIRLKRTAPEDLTSAAPRPFIVPVGRGLQCAQYARMRSGLSISGNARAWWWLAAAKYRRDTRPALGAVMVMGGTRHGHVAVVVEMRSSREVLVDHANWLNRGEIQMGALVRDVSINNDWSQVRVWYPPINDLGNRAYPVYGFILNEPIQQPQTIPTAAPVEPVEAPVRTSSM